MESKYKQRAEVVLNLEDKKTAEAIFKAINVETWSLKTERSHTFAKLEGTKIILNFASSDLIALRAALNSYLRMLYAVIKTLDVVKNGYGRGKS